MSRTGSEGAVGTTSARPDTAGLRHDLRLIPAAGAVWAAGLLGLIHGWWTAATVGGCAVLASVIGLRREARVRTPGSTRRLGVWVALLLCGALAVGSIAIRIALAEDDPLRQYAARGADAVLRVTIVQRPKPIRSPGYAGHPSGARSVLFTGEVRPAGTAAGRRVDSSARVTVIAPYAEWAELLPGQDVTVRGGLAPGESGELTTAVVYARGPPERTQAPPWWQRWAAALRQGLHETSATLDKGPAGLLPGLVVGDTSELPPRVEEDFTVAGMTHLTAVSGSNVTIICGAVLLLCRLARAGPRVSAAVSGVALVGYVVVCGPEPSVLRAGVMGAIGLLALALGRKSSTVPSLAVAVICLVTSHPTMAASFGFALSVVATAGIVLLAPRWSRAMTGRHVPRGVAAAIAVPTAAFLAAAPVIAGMAGRISLVDIPANLLAAPVLAPVTILGALAMLLAPWWPSAADLVVRPAELGLEWLILVARQAAAVPGALLDWPAGWWGGLLAALAVTVLVLAVRFRSGRVVVTAGAVSAALVLVPARVLTPPWPPHGWSFVVCDVGQGDALVLATGRPGSAVVVDTGPSPGPVDECLDRLDVRRVPLVVLTHLHADHIGGLRGVLADRAVGAVAVEPGRTPDWARRRVAEQAAAAGVGVRALHTGQRLGWSALRLSVLGPLDVPPESSQQDEGTAVNNTSVVLAATTRAGRILLTGDVELAAQAGLLASDARLRADILKVPHHGSGVFLPRFLRAVDPRIAVVSVGADNDYGHPSRRVLRALRGGGALVARTDRSGALAILLEHGAPVVYHRGADHHASR